MDYNPHAPRTLGQEWVPIKQANFVPDTVTERGYTFNIAHAVTPVSGSYNIAVQGNMRHLLALYPAGQEDLTGPIEEVVIPVSGAVVTGSGSSVVGAATATLALTSPFDSTYVDFSSALTADIGVSFDMAPYAAQLNGKRILDVELVYQIASTPTNLASVVFNLRRAAPSTSVAFFPPISGGLTLNSSQVAEFSIGDLNFFWDSTSLNPISTIETYPWRSQELALFATTAGAFRLIGDFQITVGDQTRSVQFGYVALKITYCEETRVRYGARSQFTGPGSQLVRMRDTAFTQPSLAAGAYTLTSVARLPAFPTTDHAIRHLYELPTFSGVTVNESLTVGDTFTKTRSDIIPQLALHTASGVVTGSHVYGNQIGAPVYGAAIANQDIHEDDLVPAAPFPQVRFYARRFGDTTVPLTLTAVDQGGMTVSITVADFDALPEIVDGWKEVTLRFASPPVFPGVSVNPNYQWSAVGETAGNQWQILGADGPSPAAPQSYAAATYQAPAGATDLLQWMSPLITGVAADPLADAVIILAVDPPTVTGFTLTPSIQAVSGIGLKCGTPPRCIPTGISYVQVGWNMGVVCYAFGTDVVNGWGNADTGQVPVQQGGVAADFDVTGGTGTIAVTATGSDIGMMYSVGSPDQDVTVLLKANAIPVGGTVQQGVLARDTNGSNYYLGAALVSTSGVISAQISRRVAGVGAVLATIPTTYTNGADAWLRFRVVGSGIQLKIWPADQPEPGLWNAAVTDASLTTGNLAGPFARRDGGNVSPTVFAFDGFQAVPGGLVDSSYELQRFDSLDNEWQTIMNTENLCTIRFNDYEARVGVLSSYRIRVCDALDFCGPWTTGSATVPAPGITPGAGAGVLIFTSNANQSGAYNLAYCMQWEGTAREEFAFPEASTVVFQDMYGKDFPTAFKQLERGGEQFSRTLLVQAAAIAPERLADFRSLRDMAWADLPYIAVRDELGDRWYATVMVPGGNVRRNRTLYFAQVDVVETTDTAYPVALP